jgi:Asp-tRNA(Asn)/Glu-tRNA(Gln) amidotransferase A subunit family amidase
VTAFASSLDQVGPMTKSVEDAAILLKAIAGHDEMDGTTPKDPVPDYAASLAGASMKGVRIGVAKEYFDVKGLDPEVKRITDEALRKCEAAGAQLVEVSLPHTEYAMAVYYIIAPAEASANLARFDGVRYGHRSADAKDVFSLYTKSRAEGFGPEVKRRIIMGTYVLSSGYYDAYYGRAQKVRTLVKRDFDEAFAKCDALLTPCAPTPAFRFKELQEAGANVCLGTDGAASSNTVDMLEHMKNSAMVQKAWRKDPAALPLNDLLSSATVNGARALGINTGEIKEGKLADLSLIDLGGTAFISPAPTLANLVYAAHSDVITDVMAGGKWIMRDRTVPNEAEILHEARKVLKQI